MEKMENMGRLRDSPSYHEIKKFLQTEKNEKVITFKLMELFDNLRDSLSQNKNIKDENLKRILREFSEITEKLKELNVFY